MFTTDRVYFWELINSPRTLLGEVQFTSDGFNMGMTIDGTKDSIKISVLSYSKDKVVKPFSVVWHENTNTYWIVANDRVEKYINESGYLYKHELQLEGAIELLNARDLTDDGFNQNTYTIETFIRRLFKLSTFEFQDTALTINYNNYLTSSDNIDYIKTYENYTLLSALNDFIGGYNCSAKLSFTQNALYELNGAILNIIPKTGITSNTYRTLDNAFKDIQQINELNKNSYGNTVVSNTQNVISTVNKIYPSVGSVKLQTEGKYKLTQNLEGASSAVIRLPSNAFKINSITMGTKSYCAEISVYSIGTTYETYFVDNVDLFNKNQLRQQMTEIIAKMKEYDNDYDNGWEADIDKYEDYLNNNFDDFVKRVIDKITVKFYGGTLYNPIYNEPSVPEFINDKGFQYFYNGQDNNKRVPWALVDKETRESMEHPTRAIYWERGSRYIRGFEFFHYHRPLGSNTTALSTLTPYADFESVITSGLLEGFRLRVRFGTRYDLTSLRANLQFSMINSVFVVDYVPMSDIKIKLDNKSLGGNIKLYNQNGKLTDSNSLSKLLNSYKTEIESENLTRYSVGYDFNTMPKVGEIILNGKEQYVINNASYNFFMNEEDSGMGYYIVAEYSLSKNVATKSLLTNPNTNIRDYGIPQNYNVKRKQLYRDFYELDLVKDTNADSDWHLPLSKVLNLSNYKQSIVNHKAIIKSTFANGDSWYYQLDTTVYLLKKSLYEIVDLQDNNIIGYGVLSKDTGFDVSKILTGGTYANVYTPISYVDDNGRVQSFDIAFCTNEQITSIWQEYISYMGVSTTDTLYNSTVFVAPQVYNGVNNVFLGAKDNCDFVITDTDYDKDALEVPVFEYAFQIDNTDNIIVGENVLDDENSNFFMYGWLLAPKGTINEYNYKTLTIQDLVRNGNIYSLTNACKFEYDNNNSILLTLYDSGSINSANMETSYGTQQLIENLDFVHNDLVLIKYKVGAVSYVSQKTTNVSGSANQYTLSIDIPIESGESSTDFAITLDSGYKDDTPKATLSYTNTEVVYHIGGENYDDTIASGTLNIEITRQSQIGFGFENVSGNASQTNLSIVADIPNDATLTNATISTNSTSAGAFANITNVDTATNTIEYELGCDDPSENINAVITYTYSIPASVRTDSVSISGTYNQEQVYYPTLSSGERITDASISNVTLDNNNVAGAYANLLSTTLHDDHYTVQYEIGCDILTQTLYATISYKSSVSGMGAKKDLLFVLKDLNGIVTDANDRLPIYINYYKIK